MTAGRDDAARSSHRKAGCVFLKGIGKFLKKIQPFKVLGNVAKSVVGAVPVIGGVAQSIVNAREAQAQRQAAGEAPAQAFINGISDQIRAPLSSSSEKNGLGMILLLGVAVLVVVLVVKR